MLIDEYDQLHNLQGSLLNENVGHFVQKWRFQDGGLRAVNQAPGPAQLYCKPVKLALARPVNPIYSLHQ